MSRLNNQLALEIYLYKYFPNINIIFYLSIILEFLQIFSSVVINTNFVDFGNNYIKVNNDYKEKYIEYLSLNNLIKNNFICKKNYSNSKLGIQNNIEINNFLTFCPYENFYFYFVLALIGCLTFLFFIVVYFGTNNKKSENLEILEINKNESRIDFIKTMLFYCPDIMFHVLGQICIDIILNSIMNSFIESDSF